MDSFANGNCPIQGCARLETVGTTPLPGTETPAHALLVPAGFPNRSARYHGPFGKGPCRICWLAAVKPDGRAAVAIEVSGPPPTITFCDPLVRKWHMAGSETS